MTEADIIRRASSQWLQKNEKFAREALREGYDLKRRWGWSDWRVSNMLTYLAMVDGDK